MAKKNIMLTISYIGIGYHGLQEVVRRSKNMKTEQKEHYAHNQCINDNIGTQENISKGTSEEKTNKSQEDTTNELEEEQTTVSQEEGCKEFATIETHIIQALLEVKSITVLNSQDPKKIHLQRMCRTDKNVSAVLNIILVRVNIIPDLLEINTVLSKTSNNRIKILGIHNVSYKYRIKHKADKRIYEYLLPLNIFNKENINIFKEAFPLNNQYLLNFDISNNDARTTLKGKFHAIMQNYVGTKNYHNFTTRANSAGKQRTIESIDIEVYNKTYLKIKIIGKAFMLHQIRKMIGFSILILLSAKEELFEKVFDENTTINIPKVPGHFLFLNKPIINFINSKRKKENREEIDISEEVLKERIEIICDAILKEEMVGFESFKIWFETFVKYSFEFGYIK